MTSNKTLYKYQGAGNDFILIEASSSLTLDSEKVTRLCHRHLGLGADGLLQVEEISQSPPLWRMRIYNSDGKLAKMCGNGLRCVAAHVWRTKGACHTFSIQSDVGTHEILPEPSKSKNSELYYAKTCFGKPSAPWKKIQVELDLKESSAWLDPSKVKGCFFLDTGVPHLFFLTSEKSLNLRSLGKYWRFHPSFSPEGTNVSVGFLKNDNTLELQTYERGVEDITLACGTAAVAAGASLLTYQNRKGADFVLLEFPTQPLMKVERAADEQFWLSGPSAFVYQTEKYSLLLS